MTHRFSAAPTALGSSSIDSQPFRAGLTFGGRPSHGFPVELGGSGELHAPFFMERRTRGSLQCSVAGNPGPGFGLNSPDCQSLLRTLCGSYSKREPQTSPFVKARRAVPKREPSPAGLGTNPDDCERRRRGTHASTQSRAFETRLSGSLTASIRLFSSARLCPLRHSCAALTAVYSVSPWRLKKRFISRLSVAR